ncbi:MAG: hypothetical protein GY943_33750 [Chloroflexi bacterium]|nr:hypothetical protein [Chloroflexota bacterium]
MSRFFSQSQRPLPTTTRLLLIFIVLAAFWLRLHHIDAFSFWTDEGLTSLRSGYSISDILSNRILIQDGITKDTHPGFFYLIIHFTRQLWGESDFAFRFPSTLAGILLVPLMFQFGRRLHSMQLGLLAALLTAVNPLYIWYANEARMYTIFVLLAAGASYVLWQALTLRREPFAANRKGLRLTDYLLLYILLAGLALYTHYTAVFLIAAQALFWGWLLWQHGQKKLILGTISVGVLAAIPLIPYTIPRLFQGSEANFYWVSPWIMLADVVRFFGLGITVDFQNAFIQLLVISFALLLLAGIVATKRWLPRLFLATYLLSVVLGLMAGSLIKPLYQGVRHIMVSSPAYLLLISWGILSLFTYFQKRWQSAHKRTDYRLLITGLLALLATAVPLTGATIAINNQYNNPRYAKNAFREAIAFIEQRAGENDIIVYHNAILLALHDHYQQRPDVDVTAAPIYPTLAKVSAPDQLQNLSQTYDRIWFITDPPADNRDLDRLVPQWLDENLAIIDTYPFPAVTTALAVIAYTTQPRYLPEQAHVEVGLMQSWPEVPTLVGRAFQFSQPVDLSTMWVNLLWRGELPAADTSIRFTLISEDGAEWGISDHAMISQPDLASPWTIAETIQQSYPVQIPFGIPPGSYALMLKPFRTNSPANYDAVLLGEVDIAAQSSENMSGERPFDTTFPINFTNGFSLQGVAFPDSEVRPGHAIPMTLFWQAHSNDVNSQNLSYQLTIMDEDGDILRQNEGTPTISWLEVWPANQLVRENSGLYFPSETQPGTYSLYWELFDGETTVSGKPSWRPWATEQVKLGEIEVIPWPLIKTLPKNTTVVNAQFGQTINLYGYDLEQSDSSINLILHWQTQATPDQNYTVFVHLTDDEGTIISQQDLIPVNGLRPTAGWRPEEVITDEYTLLLSEPLTNGRYQLLVGLYTPDTFTRPTVTVDGVAQSNNQLIITTVTSP